jgi:hypothetical protein
MAAEICSLWLFLKKIILTLGYCSVSCMLLINPVNILRPLSQLRFVKYKSFYLLYLLRIHVPLLGFNLLLAEMFEGNPEKCTTAGTVENVVMLCDRYVKMKWDVYLSETKKSDPTTVHMLIDDEKLHKTFIYKHMTAALVAILSTQHLEKLTDKKIAEGEGDFLQKITEGIEKTGIIDDVVEGRPVFQHRNSAEYLVATWLCDNFQNF